MNHQYLFHKVVLVSLIFGGLQASEKQFNCSSYFDSNPTEKISQANAAIGFKAKGSLAFKATRTGYSYFGSLLGQGFLEPVSVDRSKLIVNAKAGVRTRFMPGLTITTLVETFQKNYVFNAWHSGRSELKLLLDLDHKKPLKQEIKLSIGRAQIDFGIPLEYVDRQVSLNLNQFMTPRLFAEVTITAGLVDYQDYPAKTFDQDVLIYTEDTNQRDHFWQTYLHLQYSGRFICGASLSYEDIGSNSVVSEATVLIIRLYSSGRVGNRMFWHLVLQGMNKNYAYPEIFSQNPYRDPEENVQNQIHLLLERIIKPDVMLFAQYGYLKNETIFDRWYYEKTTLEVGLKLSL